MHGTFVHDFQGINLSDNADYGPDAYDMDTNITTIYAHATSQTHIPPDHFSRISATG